MYRLHEIEDMELVDVHVHKEHDKDCIEARCVHVLSNNVKNLCTFVQLLVRRVSGKSVGVFQNVYTHSGETI